MRVQVDIELRSEDEKKAELQVIPLLFPIGISTSTRTSKEEVKYWNYHPRY
jgi:hypothetical protein